MKVMPSMKAMRKPSMKSMRKRKTGAHNLKKAIANNTEMCKSATEAGLTDLASHFQGQLSKKRSRRTKQFKKKRRIHGHATPSTTTATISPKTMDAAQREYKAAKKTFVKKVYSDIVLDPEV